MAQVVSRNDAKLKTVGDGSNNAIPIFQSFATVGHKEWYQLPIQPTAPTTAFSSAPTTIFYDLEKHDTKGIEDMFIKITLSATSDTQIVGAPYLFDLISIWSNRGSGSELVRIRAEDIITWCLLTMNDEEQQHWSKLMNFSLVDMKNGEKKYWYDENSYIRANTTKTIYLPLPLNWIKFGALDMSHCNPLRFRFECSNDIVINGSVSNISLDNIELVVCSHNESDFDEKAREGRNMTKNHCYHFLESERLQINDKTLTAGNKTECFVDGINGKIAFFVIVIKGNQQPNASDKTLFNFLDIGDSTLDLENTSGRSMLGNGNPIPVKILKHHLQEQLGNKTFTGYYILPLTEDIKKAYIGGSIQGFYQLYGQRDKIVINFDTAPTSETHQISIGTTASAGNYRYVFDNSFAISDSDASYNDSTSALATLIEDIPALKDRNITVDTIDNNLASTTTQNVTFDASSGAISEMFGKLTIVGNGIPKVTSTNVSTYYDNGWTTGSNYQIEIFAYKYKKFIVTKEGTLRVEEL